MGLGNIKDARVMTFNFLLAVVVTYQKVVSPVQAKRQKWAAVFVLSVTFILWLLLLSASDCPGGNRNFNINSNAQQIVRSIAICKHLQLLKQRRLEEFKTYLLTNVSSLQATSSEWRSGITTRYIYIKQCRMTIKMIYLQQSRKLTEDSSKVISEKRKRHRTNIPVKNGF